MPFSIHLHTINNLFKQYLEQICKPPFYTKSIMKVYKFNTLLN